MCSRTKAGFRGKPTGVEVPWRSQRLIDTYWGIGTWEPSAPPEPAQCHTYHACHVKRRWMSQSATPATQSAATCRQVARLPRKVQLHVAKNKLCDETVHKLCVQVPRLPRETKVDVSKCHACHAKCSYMSPSATPATQKATATTAARGNPACHQSQPSAIRTTPATWNEGGCLKVPRLPRKVQLHVAKWHKLHVAKNKLCDETVHKLCVQVPRLPRETKVDVSKCHACHAKCSYMSPSATPATQKAAATTVARGNPARHQSQPSAIRATPAMQSDDPWRQEQVVWWNCSQVVCPSTTPATWNEGGCVKVPRLPRKVRLHVAKCHACHAKSRGDHGGTWEPSAPPEPAHCHTCHACQAKWRSMMPRTSCVMKLFTSCGPSTTPATWNEGGCLKVPRLPRKVRLHVAKCHACHAKSRGDHGGTWEPSAPPEPAQCHTCHACHAKWRSMMPRTSCVMKLFTSCVSKYHACHVKRSPSLSSVYLSSCLPVYLPVCLSIYLSICGAVSFSVM